ncbi:hypothetical protein MML48_7g00020244 [Holotrichia oblita]|uniref:Uncharacterized protein n=1 Tax=Holotrichia oblita TaxID=644536 RepID=A0ACB9SS89_HOLOL|nr:hypothetical protein MML48_7g00020244 [Holotrichia oblita]
MEDQVLVPLLITQASQQFLSIIEQTALELSDSSDDETQIISILNTLTQSTYPREREVPRCENYYERTVPRYLPSEFQSHFRMTPDAFNALSGYVIPRLRLFPHQGRPLANPEKKLLAVVWLLATPDSYRSVGEKFDLGKGSISDVFMRVIKILTDLAAIVIKWPSQENCAIIMDKFAAFGGMTHVIGAIDGTYVPIKAPKENSHVYVTRKHNYAMTLQAIAEPSLKFTDAFCAYPGSTKNPRNISDRILNI